MKALAKNSQKAALQMNKAYYIFFGREVTDGPFASPKEAIDLLKRLVGGKYATPEGINNYYCAVLDKPTKVMDLLKDSHGKIIDGKLIHFIPDYCWE